MLYVQIEIQSCVHRIKGLHNYLQLERVASVSPFPLAR